MSRLSQSRIRPTLEQCAARGLEAYLSEGPLERAIRRTRRLARLGRRLLRWQWDWTLQNLRLVYGPALDEVLLRRFAEFAFENYFLSILEGLRAREVRVEPIGIERLRSAWAQQRGVLACSLHFGSWEPGLRQLAATGLPVAAVYRPFGRPKLERQVATARDIPGVEWLRRSDALGIVRALRQPKVVVLMVDTEPSASVVSVDFLGIPALCSAGPARLALRFGAPLLPVCAVRTGTGTAAGYCGLPIQPVGDPRDAEAVRALTQQLHAAFEPWVREHPEQFNWLFPRWRARPDGRVWKRSDPIEVLWRERTGPFLPLPEDLRRSLAEESNSVRGLREAGSRPPGS